MTIAEITTSAGILELSYDLSLLSGNRKENYAKHDNFFEEFTGIWQTLMLSGRLIDAGRVWEKALEIANSYEAEYKNSIHKGTAYYFWGVTCILSGDLDKGFLLMHQALDEDIKLSEAIGGAEDFKKTPAYAFTKIDDTVLMQYFRDEVKQVAMFVNDKLLIRYRISTIARNMIDNGQQMANANMLDMNGLRSKILENDNLGNVPFFLVYNFFRLKKILDAKKEIRQNDFASLLQVQTILGFCIVAEELLKKAQGKNTWPVYLSTFALKNNFPNLTQAEAGSLTGKFNSNFRETLVALLDSTYVYNSSITPSQIEVDLLVLYSIRNASAHNLNSEKIIYEKFEEISQRVLNALFFIVEKGCL